MLYDAISSEPIQVVIRTRMFEPYVEVIYEGETTNVN